MGNLKSAAATLKPLFENQEIAAMAEICELLQALPDEAARLRVMRWSFARFGGEEFKRAVPSPAPPAVTATQAAPIDNSTDVPTSRYTDPTAEAEDLANQVSELNDLFSRPPALVLNKLRRV
jgi:hypothetical protein